MRFFIGTELAIPVIDRLSLLQEELTQSAKAQGAAIRWTAPTHIRLNLKIFGDLALGADQRIQEMLVDFTKALRPFHFDTRTTAIEQKPGQAKLITTMVHDATNTLSALREHIEQAGDHIGFTHDTTSWEPRVLIGRLATPGPAIDIMPLIAPYRETQWGETHCKELILYRAQMIGPKPQVRVARRFELGTGR